jgi:hypothetical protein
MKKDRTYKLELLKGLMSGTRSIDEMDAPEFMVLFPAEPPPPGARITPPKNAKYYDLLTERYITDKEYNRLRIKFNGLKCIFITYDPD